MFKKMVGKAIARGDGTDNPPKSMTGLGLRWRLKNALNDDQSAPGRSDGRTAADERPAAPTHTAPMPSAPSKSAAQVQDAKSPDSPASPANGHAAPPKAEHVPKTVAKAKAADTAPNSAPEVTPKAAPAAPAAAPAAETAPPAVVPALAQASAPKPVKLSGIAAAIAAGKKVQVEDEVIRDTSSVNLDIADEDAIQHNEAGEAFWGPIDNESARAKASGLELVIDQWECISCGTCVENTAAVFVLPDDAKAVAYRQAGPMDLIQDAIDACPVTCIHWVDDPEQFEVLNDVEGQPLA